MDRFTWGAVIAVVLLSVAALVTVLAVRRDRPPPDPTTPEGVAMAYILAIQDKRADDAWDLLDSPAAAGIGPMAFGATTTQAAFRQQVNSMSRSGNRRIRIAQTRVSGDTARVDIEITVVSSGPFWFRSASESHTGTFSLKRAGDTWRITAAPPIWDLA